jgi:hypothetical protein
MINNVRFEPSVFSRLINLCRIYPTSQEAESSQLLQGMLLVHAAQDLVGASCSRERYCPVGPGVCGALARSGALDL